MLNISKSILAFSLLTAFSSMHPMQFPHGVNPATPTAQAQLAPYTKWERFAHGVDKHIMHNHNNNALKASLALGFSHAIANNYSTGHLTSNLLGTTLYGLGLSCIYRMGLLLAGFGIVESLD